MQDAELERWKRDQVQKAEDRLHKAPINRIIVEAKNHPSSFVFFCLAMSGTFEAICAFYLFGDWPRGAAGGPRP